ncbi:MAG: S-layer protein [Nitrosarchaeum sp.]|nr:S-layer protein [Nitrosarchaeum sp.]
MNSKRLIKKIVALGAGASMVGMTLAGAMAYNLADYPAPFVQNGVFDGSIVVGERAATSDVIGAIDIAASLQASSTMEVELNVPGSSSVTLVGDAVQFRTSSDILTIGENVSETRETFTESDLQALKGGVVSTDKGSTNYNQYLRFEATSLGNMYVDYTQNRDDEVGDFLIIADDFPFFEWELEFEEGFESEITDCTGSSGSYVCKLDDLEDEVVNIFGEDFTIVDTTLRETGTIVLELMGGDITDTSARARPRRTPSMARTTRRQSSSSPTPTTPMPQQSWQSTASSRMSLVLDRLTCSAAA